MKEFLTSMLDGMLSVSPKTLERYGELAERQIYPHLGDEKIRYLTREQIESWHATLLGKGLLPHGAPCRRSAVQGPQAH